MWQYLKQAAQQVLNKIKTVIGLAGFMLILSRLKNKIHGKDKHDNQNNRGKHK